MRTTLASLVVTLTLMLPGAALACDPMTRAVDFLGWTKDSRFFVYRVTETTKGKTAAGRLKMQRAYVNALTGDVEEFVLEWRSPYPKPADGTRADFDAWLKAHPLASPQTANPAHRLMMKVGEATVFPQKGVLVAPKEADTQLGVEGGSSVTWRGGKGVCGSARGFWSPDGHFVAWLTGPQHRTCDDCHGSYCCAEPEAYSLRADD